MPEYMYDIILKTEIGDKKGQLALKINQNIVEGMCTLLGFTEPCSGFIDEKGNCTLRGRLKNFRAVYDYMGAGYVDGSQIDLVLNSGRKRFRLIGAAADGKNEKR